MNHGLETYYWSCRSFSEEEEEEEEEEDDDENTVLPNFYTRSGRGC